MNYLTEAKKFFFTQHERHDNKWHLYFRLNGPGDITLAFDQVCNDQEEAIRELDRYSEKFAQSLLALAETAKAES
jgi:hypothetical protein